MQQKKKLSKRVISYALALVMVFSTFTGIVPGSGMTVQAATYGNTTVVIENIGVGDFFNQTTLTAGYNYEVDLNVDGTGMTLNKSSATIETGANETLSVETYVEYAPAEPISVNIAKVDPVTPTGMTGN